MSLHLNPSEAEAFTRRRFLASSLAFASASAFVPAFLQNSGLALPQAQAGMTSIAGVNQDRVLVVIQLSGGNDGLNTVVPFGMDEYQRARRGIGLRIRDALSLDGNAPGIGLHPALADIKGLYDDGLCSIIQGVGYPNPNRSHFKSMDIWHTARDDGNGPGWLGRYFDSECCGHGKGESGRPPRTGPGPGAVAIGSESPGALDGLETRPVVLEEPRTFGFGGRDEIDALAGRVARESAEHATSDSPEDFLARTALDARVSSDVIRKAVAVEPLTKYPNSPLARQLQMIGSMIRAGMPTRVYYAVHGGFDTHAGQGGPQGRHANLLRQLAEATRAFYRDLGIQRNDGRVLTMAFSEFGRRLGQNGSGGTDHGTAAPVMLFGPMVRPGLIGNHPSLTQLQDGDLIHSMDFRSLYAEILGKWLQADAEKVLGGRYRPTAVIRA